MYLRYCNIILGEYKLSIRPQTGADICAVPTAEAVATGEVNCYNFIGHSQCFRGRSVQDVASVTQAP